MGTVLPFRRRPAPAAPAVGDGALVLLKLQHEAAVEARKKAERVEAEAAARVERATALAPRGEG